MSGPKKGKNPELERDISDDHTGAREQRAAPQARPETQAPASASLPTVLVSSVIRSTHQGESHGGVYLVDLERDKQRQLLDWDDPTISWEGRGADRGLRGIAFHERRVYVAASDEVFVFDPDFNLIDSFTNAYLQHCHEIDVCGDRLYLTSTGYDAVLEVDLNTHRFLRGFGFRMDRLRYAASRIPRHLGMQSFRVRPPFRVFDPEGRAGPSPKDQLHINSVVVNERGMHVSGRMIGCLLHIPLDAPGREQLASYVPTPFGTHNVLPLASDEGDGAAIMNDTNRDLVLIVDEEGREVAGWPIVQYDEDALRRNDLPDDHARQAFGRGLEVWNDSIIVGSSPATVTVYVPSATEPVASVNLTMDVRNAIHGLEVWPFGTE